MIRVRPITCALEIETELYVYSFDDETEYLWCGFTYRP